MQAKEYHLLLLLIIVVARYWVVEIVSFALEKMQLVYGRGDRAL